MTDRGVRLGTAVSARRTELGRTRADVQMLSRKDGDKGVSQEAIRAIERGERETIHAATARGLERGLDWPTGYVDRLMAGEAEELAPRPTDEPPPQLLDMLTRRLAAMEAAMGIREPAEMSNEQAMAVILGLLSDDQFRIVAAAVRGDPRYQSTIT